LDTGLLEQLLMFLLCHALAALLDYGTHDHIPSNRNSFLKA
jgi:hypothetical protein